MAQSPSPSAVQQAPISEGETVESVDAPQDEPPAVQVKSDFAILIDADTGAVLFDKSAHSQAYPASTTKIMTGLIACENAGDLQEEVEIGAEVNGFSENNITIGLEQYEKVTLEDLLYGTLLPSGNDAAAALAVHFGGSKEGFAKMMNDKVAELGLKDSHFVNPHGLTDESHYTTAYDLAMITRAALQNELFAQVVSTPEYTLHKTNKRSEEKVIYNSNRFITSKESVQDYHWSAVTGVKTGSTSAAGGCLVTSASKDGINLIAVTLHDTSKGYEDRWSDSRALLEYGFKELDTLALDELSFDPVSATVSDASRKDSENGTLMLDLKTSGVTISGLRKDLEKIRKDESKLTLIPVINQGKDLVAPVQKGQVVGSCTILDGENRLAVVDLVAQRNVASVEGDPSNPVSSLVTDVTASAKTISLRNLILICAGVVLLAAVLIFIIVRRRSRHAPHFHARRRRSGYYNYHHR